MGDTKRICKEAFDLLARSPRQAGMTLCLARGPARLVEPSHSELSGGLIRQFGLGRGPAMRPGLELHVYAEERDGKFAVRVERVTGMAALATIPDPTDNVGAFLADTLDEAAEKLSALLSEKVPSGIELSIDRLLYRTDSFASCSLPADRANSESMIWPQKLRGTADQQLRQFAEEVTGKALSWGKPNLTPAEISLWFYPNPKEISAIYVTITPAGGSYTVTTEDRVCWPWKKERSKTVATAEAVKALVSDYLAGNHAFEFEQVRVYFAYSVAE